MVDTTLKYNRQTSNSGVCLSRAQTLSRMNQNKIMGFFYLTKEFAK